MMRSPQLAGRLTSILLAFAWTGVALAADVRDVIKKVGPCTAVVRTESGLGSGFLISADGLLVTNHHVVDGVRSAAVKLHNGDLYDQVWLVAADPLKDFAILRIAGFGLPGCTLADSSAVEVGQEVIAIGNPYGLDFTVSTGIVSALRSDLAGTELGYQVIQTTAPISPGSSGGPLVDADGQVIGITTFKLASGENLNFAVPINYVRGARGALPESDRRGTPLAKLAWQTQAGRKTTVSFRELAWGMGAREIERRMGRPLKRNKDPHDPLELRSLPGVGAYTASDTLLGRKLAVDFWLDRAGLGAVSIPATLRAAEAGGFIRDLLSALSRNYGMPADGGAEDDGIWAVWSDGEGNAVSIEVEVGRCGRLPLARAVCYETFLIYLRSDLAAQVARQLGERLDPF